MWKAQYIWSVCKVDIIGYEQYRENDERGVKMKKEEDFLFGEEPLIKQFGKEEVERLKKEEPEIYENLRNSPIFMESDVIYMEKRQNDRGE